MVGLRVLLLHPKWAMRSCDDCQRYRHHEDQSDELFGKPMCRPLNSDNKITRDRGEFPPCKVCPKIAPGDAPIPQNAQELSEKNWKAYQHWQECKAVGSFPDDAIVRKNAAIIQKVHDEYDRQVMVRPLHDLVNLIPLLAVNRGRA